MGIEYFKNEKQYSLVTALLLSLQRALLCEVTPNLRMVGLEWDDQGKKVFITFYYDGEITDAELDSASCVAGEVYGDFGEDTQVIEKCVRLDYPARLPFHTQSVYHRKEKPPDDEQ